MKRVEIIPVPLQAGAAIELHDGTECVGCAGVERITMSALAGAPAIPHAMLVLVTDLNHPGVRERMAAKAGQQH